MVATGELIRMINYLDDISTTLRRVVANIPMMSEEECKRVAEHIRKNIQPNLEGVVQSLEKGGK